MSKWFGKRKQKAVVSNSIPSVVQSPYSIASGYLYRHDYFDNIYDNAIALAKGFARVEPYMINDKGSKLAGEQNILDKIYNPLSGISAYQFRKTLALMTITHNDFYILIHTNSNNYVSFPTEANITGFDILQPTDVSKASMNGELYSVSTSNGMISVSDRRLMHMTDVLDPRDLNSGYSPLKAVQKWATLDDFIIAYQHGLFMNGAVPQGTFNICATKSDFETIAHKIQATMRNNSSSGVLFNHIPINAAGQSQTPTITWVPMASSNKDMSTTELQTNNNRRIDNVFGVPQEIRGYLQNSNYASVRVAELVFEKYSVGDLLMSIWSKFNSELSRCLGGMDKAISYEHELPTIADEEKVRAETQSINLSNIYNALDRGFSIDSIINALDLPDRYRELAKSSSPTPNNAEATSNDNNPADPISKDASANKIDVPILAMVDVDLSKFTDEIAKVCIDSQTQLADRAVSLIGNPEKDAFTENKYSVPSIYDYYYPKQDNNQTAEQLAIPFFCALMVSGRQYDEQAQIYVVKVGLNVDLPNFTAADQKMRRLVQQYLNDPSSELQQAIIAEAKVSNSELIKYYWADAENLAKSYNEETVAKINTVFKNAVDSNLPVNDVIKQLKDLGLEEWRAKRLAVSETHRVKNKAYEHVSQVIQKTTHKRMEKMIVHSEDDAPCMYCLGLIGKWIPLDDNFVEKGEMMHSLDGESRKNDFEPISDAHIHPNCQCKLVTRFIAD